MTTDYPLSFQATEHRLNKIKGGLAMQYTLPDVPLHIIFTKIVQADCKIELVEPEFRENASFVVKGMFENPCTLENYVTKQRLYISLSWAYDKLELENTACDDCKVELVDGACGIFRIYLSPGFCDHNEIRASSLLLLSNVADLTGYRIMGRVVDFDPATSTLNFVPFGKRKIALSNQYRISVVPSSLVYRSRYRTLSWLLTLDRKEVVFPKLIDSTLPLVDFERAERDVLPKMKFSRQFNEFQKKAVYAIVSGHHGALPYILHGPPGTGKTTVLVEAIRMLLNDVRRTVRILVCTPSNTAADLIACELLNKAKVPFQSLFRMYSLMKPVAAQNKELKDISYICNDDDGEEVYGIPCFEELLDKRIIVCTLAASTFLVSGGLTGKFTHIIIDEAGQANEVDTLIPMVGLSGFDTRMILAGDPKQLGPVETIDFLNKNELSNSLMERFSKLPCYNNDRRFICMLELNYRSHATIIKVPSELFYDYRLTSAGCGIFMQKNSLSEWEKLPKKGFPIIFHHVEGNEVSEQNGYSYCNMQESDMIVYYVNLIRDMLNVDLNAIGVISPYKYQVRMLRYALAEYSAITIDSVERFQGSERRVILVSTVRNDKLGFVADDKRFNTTVMRAEELLVVVGNCCTLSRNRFWRRFINYCDDNGAILNRPELLKKEMESAETEEQIIKLEEINMKDPL